MSERMHVALIANTALAGEPATRLDHQFVDQHLALDLAVGQDFKARTLDLALEMTTHHQMVGFEVALDAPVVADRDVGARVYRALDAPVDVEVVV